jgi:molecular chaperone HtpG
MKKEKKQLNIHSENILPIIKKWLYSEREIFVRELISNACDAIQKRSILSGLGKATAEEGRIDVVVDREKKTITISDNGVGLDAQEAESYLSQIAFSGAEEFVKAYQLKDAFIGHFGLGFYSSYMVAESVEVLSKSCKGETQPIRWFCDGGIDYSIESCEKNSIGTDVILHISEENHEFLEEGKTAQLLKTFCRFLPHPIYCNGVRINDKEPLWLKKPSDCTEKEYIDFYHTLYPFQEPPLFWLHINVDYPFHVQGILYFPHAQRDYLNDGKGVKLYSNRVFVSADCKDILPEYLMMLQGVIDSPDIPLNVSRSYLQVDKKVRQLSGHISKKVVDALGALFRGDRARYEAVWKDVEVVVKFGSLQDAAFFERAQELFLWKSVDGSYSVTVELPKTVYYIDGEAQHPLVKALEAKGVKVFLTTSVLDNAVMGLFERSKTPIYFKRVDAEEMQELLDPAREKQILDAQGRSEASLMADAFRRALPTQDVKVEAKSLAHDELFGYLQIDEQSRRVRDHMRNFSKSDTHEKFPLSTTFIVNTNNPVIRSVCELAKVEPEKSKTIAKFLFDLAKLHQKELSQGEVGNFIANALHMIDNFVSNKEQ